MIRCAEYKALPDRERSALDLQLFKLADLNRWKRCPGCGIVVERERGCFYMTCSCGTRFCYDCGVKVLFTIVLQKV